MKAYIKQVDDDGKIIVQKELTEPADIKLMQELCETFFRKAGIKSGLVRETVFTITGANSIKTLQRVFSFDREEVKQWMMTKGCDETDIKILKLLYARHTMAEVADDVCLSVHGVDYRLRKLYEKFLGAGDVQPNEKKLYLKVIQKVKQHFSK